MMVVTQMNRYLKYLEFLTLAPLVKRQFYFIKPQIYVEEALSCNHVSIMPNFIVYFEFIDSDL